MPADDEEDYEDDGGNEMVDMEDDEAQPENDQLQSNKMDDDEPGAYDENQQPAVPEKTSGYDVPQQIIGQDSAEARGKIENAYQPAPGVAMQD